AICFASGSNEGRTYHQHALTPFKSTIAPHPRPPSFRSPPHPQIGLCGRGNHRFTPVRMLRGNLLTPLVNRLEILRYLSSGRMERRTRVVLGQLGLSQEAETIYRAMLAEPAWGVGDLVRHLALPERVVRKA